MSFRQDKQLQGLGITRDKQLQGLDIRRDKQIKVYPRFNPIPVVVVKLYPRFNPIPVVVIYVSFMSIMSHLTSITRINKQLQGLGITRDKP